MATYTSTLASHHTAKRRKPSLFNVIGIYSQRRTLARLDDHQLHDIGITREEAQRESARSFWDLPKFCK